MKTIILAVTALVLASLPAAAQYVIYQQSEPPALQQRLQQLEDQATYGTSLPIQQPSYQQPQVCRSTGWGTIICR